MTTSLLSVRSPTEPEVLWLVGLMLMLIAVWVTALGLPAVFGNSSQRQIQSIRVALHPVLETITRALIAHPALAPATCGSLLLACAVAARYVACAPAPTGWVDWWFVRIPVCVQMSGDGLSKNVALQQSLTTLFAVLAGIIVGFDVVAIGTLSQTYTPTLADTALRAPRLWIFLGLAFAGSVVAIYQLAFPPVAQWEESVPIVAFVSASIALAAYLRSLPTEFTASALTDRITVLDEVSAGGVRWDHPRTTLALLVTARRSFQTGDILVANDAISQLLMVWHRQFTYLTECLCHDQPSETFYPDDPTSRFGPYRKSVRAQSAYRRSLDNIALSLGDVLPAPTFHGSIWRLYTLLLAIVISCGLVIDALAPWRLPSSPEAHHIPPGGDMWPTRQQLRDLLKQADSRPRQTGRSEVLLLYLLDTLQQMHSDMIEKIRKLQKEKHGHADAPQRLEVFERRLAHCCAWLLVIGDANERERITCMKDVISSLSGESKMIFVEVLEEEVGDSIKRGRLSDVDARAWSVYLETLSTRFKS